jgi:hypothetical protein
VEAKNGAEEEETEEQGNRNLMLELQRAFTFLLESTRQHYDPTKLVHSCKVLPLEFPVLHQNDAAEFCDGLVDKLKDMLKGMQKKASQAHFETLNSLFRVQMCYQNIRQPCLHMTERFDDQVSVKLEIKGKSSIMESLKAFVEGELMEGSNALECEGCNNEKRDTRRRTCFTKLPDVLIFNLKRFVFNMHTFETEKINDRCEFPLVLDMRPFTKEGLEQRDRDAQASVRQASPVARKGASPIGRGGAAMGFDGDEHQYALSGIVVHSGGAHAGHYYSMIRCDDEVGDGVGDGDAAGEPKSHRWLRFDDTSVKEFDMSTLEAECFGGETTRLVREPSYPHREYEQPAPIEKNAFLLFYQRIDSTGSANSPSAAAAAFAAAAMASPVSASTLAAIGQPQDTQQVVCDHPLGRTMSAAALAAAALARTDGSGRPEHPTHHRLIQPCPPHLALYETQVWLENMRQVRRQQFYDDELLYFMAELLRTRAIAATKEREQERVQGWVAETRLAVERAESDARLASLGTAFLFGPVLVTDKRVRLEKQRGKPTTPVGRAGSQQGSMVRAVANEWVKYIGALCKNQSSLAPSKELVRQLVKTPQVELMLLWQDEQQWRHVCAELLLELATCCYADPTELRLLKECPHDVLLAVSMPTVGAANAAPDIDSVGPPPSALGELLAHLLMLVPTTPPTRAHEFHALEQLMVLLHAMFTQLPLLLHVARAHSVLLRLVTLFLASKEHNLTGSTGAGFASGAPLATVSTQSGTTGHGHGSSMVAVADEVPRVFLDYKPLLQLIATLAITKHVALDEASAVAAAGEASVLPEGEVSVLPEGEASVLPEGSQKAIASAKFLEMALDEMVHSVDGHAEAGLRIGMYHTAPGCSAAAGGKWSFNHSHTWVWFVRAADTGSDACLLVASEIHGDPELLQQPAVRVMTSLCRDDWEASTRIVTFLTSYVRMPQGGHAGLAHQPRGSDFKTSVSLALRTVLSMDDEYYNQRMQLLLADFDVGLFDRRRGRARGSAKKATSKDAAAAAADCTGSATQAPAARGQTTMTRSLLSVARFVLDLNKTHGLTRRWLLTKKCMQALHKLIETISAKQHAQVQRNRKQKTFSDLQELWRQMMTHKGVMRDVRRRAGMRGLVSGAPREEAAGGCGLGPVPRVRIPEGSCWCRITGAGEGLVNGRYVPHMMFSDTMMFTKQVGAMKLSIIRCVMKSGARHWFISRCEDPPGTSKDVDYYHNTKDSQTPPKVSTLCIHYIHYTHDAS